VKNLAKSILNYYSTYNETRFRFDTRINFAWSNDDKTLDIPFFPEVAQNLLNEIKDGKRINLSIHPEEHSISWIEGHLLMRFPGKPKACFPDYQRPVTRQIKKPTMLSGSSIWIFAPKSRLYNTTCKPRR